MDWSFLDAVEARCKAAADFATTGQDRIFSLTKDQLIPAAQVLRDNDWFIEDVTVIDVAEGYEASYHFAHFEQQGVRVAYRVLTDHEDGSFPSIADVYPGAVWHERESKDMYNVVFEGIPNDRPLLLDASMADEAPLRKTEKTRTSVLDMMPPFTVLECEEEDHPWPALFEKREEERKQAEEEARIKAEEEAKKKAEEEATKKAEAEAAAQDEQAAAE